MSGQHLSASNARPSRGDVVTNRQPSRREGRRDAAQIEDDWTS
jgi:hypothetical protein